MMPKDEQAERIHGSDAWHGVHQFPSASQSVRFRVMHDETVWAARLCERTVACRRTVGAHRPAGCLSESESAGVRLQPRERVDQPAVDAHLEVEVVGGRAARAADGADELAR